MMPKYKKGDIFIAQIPQGVLTAGSEITLQYHVTYLTGDVGYGVSIKDNPYTTTVNEEELDDPLKFKWIYSSLYDASGTCTASCECGVSKLGMGKHSDYCPLYIVEIL